jgi:hypothetical protein
VVIIVIVVVTAGAFDAHTDAALNHWVGWATIVAVPLAGLGVLVPLWDKVAGSTDKPGPDLRTAEDELAAVVLSQAQTARARLIGTDEAEDQPANVRFARSAGRFREVGGAPAGDLASILSYYQSLSPGRLVVLGDPGAGKTVLVLEFQVRLLEGRRRDPAVPVPVLVSASAYDPGQGWDGWLASYLAFQFAIPRRTAAQLVSGRRILPIVDGLDEMDPADQPPQRAQALVTALNAAMSGHERAPLVITCRHHEYQALTRGIDRATHIEMTPLDGNQAAAYLRGQFRTPDEARRWEPVLAALNASPHGPFAAQLSTPWRLTLALAAFRDADDPAAILPPAWLHPAQYARQVDALLLGRYVPSAVRLHSPGTPYADPKQVGKWLTALAYGLAWQSRHGQSATDITPHDWWRPSGGPAIRLAHTALAALPASACLAVFITGPWYTWLQVYGELLVPTMVFSVVFRRYRSPIPHRLTARHIATRVGLRSLARRLAPWLAVGLVLGLTSWLESGKQAVSVGFAALIAFGLAPGVAFGLSGALDDPSPQARRPREVIKASGIYGLVFALVLMLTFVLVNGLAYGFGTFGFGNDGRVIVLRFGFWFGLACSLGYFAGAWTRFRITVAVNAARGRAPLRFGAFLDWAVQAGLLRVSGISYQFRHRQLQDWLTSPSEP